MFLISAASALAGLLAAISILVVHKIITNRLSLLRFKKLSKGMPIFEELKLLGNHISTMILSEDNCSSFQRAHERHGPYVGGLLGDKFFVSTTDLDLIKRIVLDENHLDRPSLNLPMAEYEDSIMLVPGGQWKRQRRVFAPALKSNKFKTSNVMQEMDESIGKVIDYIERKLGKNENEIIADDVAHKYSLDLVFSCFYKQYNLINFDDPKDEWTSMADQVLHDVQHNPLIRLSMIFSWFSRPLDWLIWNFHKQGVARRRVIDFVRMQTKLGMEARKQAEELATRGELRDESNFVLKDGTKFRRNLVDNIIDDFLDGKLTQTEYFNSSCFLLSAADKTAADCIAFTMYLLSIHLDVQKELRESIKKHGVNSEYLSWVLSESLRLMPLVPAGCSRTVDKPYELENGWVIPASSLLITNVFVIHRLKKYWGDDAEEFKPERWADTSQHHPMQFLAFGAGPRACLGREFALFHMKSLFTALLTRYEFEGTQRTDAFKFSSPALIFTIPNSHTYVTIDRVD